MNEDSLKSTNSNPFQPLIFDYTRMIGQLIERISENYEKTVSSIPQILNFQQENLNKITDILSGISALKSSIVNCGLGTFFF